MLIVDLGLVLAGGWLAGRLVERLGLPGLVGMLVYGIAIGPFGLDWISTDFQDRAPDVSLVALVVVIASSFFAIDLATLRRDGTTIGLVGTVPGVVEGVIVMAAAVVLLDFTWVQGGILGFTLAVVSPAVVVPTMIRLKAEGWGMDKDVPVIVLSATNLDGLVAIVLWTLFMTIEVGRADVVDVVTDTVAGIVLGAAVGLGLGWVAARAFDRWVGGRSVVVRTAVVLGAAFAVFLGAQAVGLNAPATLLVFGLAAVNSTRTDVGEVGTATGRVWKVASIVLFVLIGTVADLDRVSTVLAAGLVIIAVGVAARLVAAAVSLRLSAPGLDSGERLFIGLATTGKATVQATLAPLVVAAGVATADDTLAVAVLAILVMAPVGATAIELTYRRLLSPPRTTVGDRPEPP